MVDRLAAEGIRFERAHPQSVVCMPSRSTILTGQHPSTHGVWMNGVPLPVDAPSVAEVLHGAGYRTALVGKAHFEPFLDPFLRFAENGLAADGHRAPRRAPPRLRAPRAGHPRGHRAAPLRPVADGRAPRGRWAGSTRPSTARSRSTPPAAATPAPPRSRSTRSTATWYHTDWVADRTMAWLDSLGADDDWFCWMSFPDPHHPWDPPAVRGGADRLARRPAARPATREDRAEREAVLDAKPRHWRLWYDGTLVSNYEAPADWVPATLTADQVREVNARNAVECELIDEALGRVLGRIAARGWADDLDVVFTTDHGELQGDFGLLFKGPYHVDALMRLPAGVASGPERRRRRPAVVTRPVGLVDLAPTLLRHRRDRGRRSGCRAGRLPVDDADAEPAASSACSPSGTASCSAPSVHLRTIMRRRLGVHRLPAGHRRTTAPRASSTTSTTTRCSRSTGGTTRPCAAVRDDLVADLWDHQPPTAPSHGWPSRRRSEPDRRRLSRR